MTIKRVTIVVATREDELRETAAAVCASLGGRATEASCPAEVRRHPVLGELLAKARRFMAERPHPLELVVLAAGSLDEAADILVSRGREAFEAAPVGLLVVGGAPDDPGGVASIETQVERFHERLAGAGVRALRSPTSTAVFLRHLPAPSPGAAPQRCILRVVPAGERWLLEAELVHVLVDFLDRTFIHRRMHDAALTQASNALGDELVRFLCERAGADWLFFYYTGSVVSSLIDRVEQVAGARGVPSLRGASEHALACGALASWQVHGKPFLMVITSGMLDELKGTLANLRQARAPGIIVCAESRATQWFAFQGTVNADEDAREVLAARRVPFVYLSDPDALAEGLGEAFRLYDAGRGPVVVLATQEVLERHAPPASPVAYPQAPATPAATADEPGIEAVLHILNRERTRVLWQCGQLDDEEERLVLAIAERAGVALTDTLTRPGTVSRYMRGRLVPSYLGTLAMYGFNDRVYSFLHPQGRLAGREAQCLFFLKSKVAQVDLPFPETRRKGLRMVQITDRKEHVAPFVERALVMDAKSFLRRVERGLSVDPEILRERLRVLEGLADGPSDAASRLPSLPMTSNYFFHELGKLLERMIVEDGYEYTGVFDVGRCGVAAVRSLPRTGVGFSGWYGRALMGDALLATPALAVTSRRHVLAFVGDGARGIVPDVLPTFVESALAHPGSFRKNVSIFYLANGSLSMIHTYREHMLSKWGGRQMRVVHVPQPAWDRELGPLRVESREIAAFDPRALREDLLAQGTLNLFTVQLAHNSEGDGITLASASGWLRSDAEGARASWEIGP